MEVLVFPTSSFRALCDASWSYEKKIRILNKRKGKEKLTILIRLSKARRCSEQAITTSLKDGTSFMMSSKIFSSSFWSLGVISVDIILKLDAYTYISDAWFTFSSPTSASSIAVKKTDVRFAKGLMAGDIQRPALRYGFKTSALGM